MGNRSRGRGEALPWRAVAVVVGGLKRSPSASAEVPAAPRPRRRVPRGEAVQRGGVKPWDVVFRKGGRRGWLVAVRTPGP